MLFNPYYKRGILTWSIFLIAFFILCLLLCNRTENEINKDFNEVENLKNIIKSERDSFEILISDLSTKNTELKKKLLVSKTIVSDSRIHKKKTELRIKEIIGKKASDNNHTVNNQNELIKGCECDTLKQEIAKYISESETQDSLQRDQDVAYESLISAQDSIIQFQTTHIEEQNKLLDSAVLQIEGLVIELKKNERKRKWSKFGNVMKDILLVAGTLIVVDAAR